MAGLVEQKRGPRNPHPNRLPAEMEQRILDYSLKYPTHGPQRTANQLRLDGVNVSSGGVCGVWLCHDLETQALIAALVPSQPLLMALAAADATPEVHASC